MTTTEEVIRLAREVWPRAVLPFHELHEFAAKVIVLAKAEENEAIIAAANALENIASTSSSTRIRRVANDALKAIRARRK